jgi:integrase
MYDTQRTRSRPIPGLGPRRPLSEITLNVALRNLDIDTKTEHCAHGFRSSASSLLHELGWDSDVIECQLAHARPGVGGIYNRSHRLAERRKMMQAWADYLDALRAGAPVTAIRA